MSTPFVHAPDQTLARGFAQHLVQWAQESKAPDHTLTALAAVAHATSLATASGHVCSYLADTAAAEKLDEDAQHLAQIIKNDIKLKLL